MKKYSLLTISKFSGNLFTLNLDVTEIISSVEMMVSTADFINHDFKFNRKWIKVNDELAWDNEYGYYSYWLDIKNKIELINKLKDES